MPTHSDLLIKLKPPGLGYTDEPEGLVNLELSAQGAMLDNISADINGLLVEMFPDTCTADTIEDWEIEYGIPVNTDKSIQQRRQLLMSKFLANPGGIDKLSIQRILFPFFGYLVDIEENKLFRTDSPGSLTDDDLLVEPESEVFRFTIHIYGEKVTTGGYLIADVRNVLDEAIPAWTDYLLLFGDFLTDDSESLTDTAGDVLTV